MENVIYLIMIEICSSLKTVTANALNTDDKCIYFIIITLRTLYRRTENKFNIARQRGEVVRACDLKTIDLGLFSSSSQIKDLKFDICKSFAWRPAIEVIWSKKAKSS